MATKIIKLEDGTLVEVQAKKGFENKGGGFRTQLNVNFAVSKSYFR